MTRFRAALALWLVWAAAALGAEPFARATIDNDGTIVPGQQVHVIVDVFAPNFFISPPQFPLFDLPNAVVTLPDERAQNMVQTIDGVQYSGIRRSYAVVPETAGTYTLPPAVIELGYSDDGKSVKGAARLPAVRFAVGEAPGGKSATLPFAARGVVLTQSFDRDPAKLTVGEALVRTVTVFGADTQAMMIPSLDLGQPQGLKVYAGAPRIADDVEGEDGTTGSSRTQTVTYIAETAGTFEIPAISCAWFDLDAHTGKTATLAPTKLIVATAAPAAEGIAPRIQADDDGAKTPLLSKTMILLVAAASILLAGIVWLLRRLLPSIEARLSTWSERRSNSEKTRFRQLAASIRKDDARTVYRRLEAWSRSAGFRSITDWVSAARDTDITRETEKLERGLFAGTNDAQSFDRAALLHAISKFHHAQAKRTRRHASHLPALNPA
jgi:BatD DUF11 like domain